MGIFRIAWKTWNISWESDCENIDSSWFIYISAWGSSADSMAAMTEGSSEDFRSQVSDLWTDASTALGRPRGERASRKKIKSGQKGRRVAKRCVFQCLSVPKGRKVGWLYKAAGAGPSGGMGDQKSKRQKHLSFGALLEAQLRKMYTPLRRESNKFVQSKTLQRRSAFWSWVVEKVRAAAARSTCRS